MKNSEFLKAISAVMMGVNKQANAMGMDFIVFDQNFVRSFKDDISVSYPLETGLSCGVRGEEFYRVLNKMSDGELNIKIVDKKLEIKKGKTTLKMNLLDDNLYNNLLERISTLNTESDGMEWYSVPKGFMEAMELCLYSVAKNSSKDYFLGIFYVDYRVISSDNTKGSYYTMEESLPSPILVPGKAAAGFLNLGIKYDAIAIHPAWIHLSHEKAVFSARLMSHEKFPVEQIFPIFEEETNAQDFEFPKELSSSLSRMEVFAGVEDNIMGVPYITFWYEKNEMVLAGARDVGEIEERIPWKENHMPEGIKVRVHPGFLKKILNLTLHCSVEKGNKFILFRTENFQHIVLSVIE